MRLDPPPRRIAECDRSETSVHSALAWSPAWPDAGISGQVVAAQNGAPLISANVTIQPGGRSVLTDSAGHFRASALPNGRYYVRVRFVGYEEAHDSVSVGLGGLRLFAALAHGMGIIDIVCTAPQYAPVESARSEMSTRLP
jgi:hypothetical protein